MARKKKDPNLLETVKTFVQNGRYHITEHASLRMKERHVILPEVLAGTNVKKTPTMRNFRTGIMPYEVSHEMSVR